MLHSVLCKTCGVKEKPGELTASLANPLDTSFKGAFLEERLGEGHGHPLSHMCHVQHSTSLGVKVHLNLNKTTQNKLRKKIHEWTSNVHSHSYEHTKQQWKISYLNHRLLSGLLWSKVTDQILKVQLPDKSQLNGHQWHHIQASLSHFCPEFIFNPWQFWKGPFSLAVGDSFRYSLNAIYTFGNVDCNPQSSIVFRSFDGGMLSPSDIKKDLKWISSSARLLSKSEG